MRVPRRTALRAGLVAAATLALPPDATPGGHPRSPGGPATPPATHGGPGRAPCPFALGVASGDPSPDGVVLWTRLAPDPLAADGLGGLGARRTDVGWELADDERFTRVVRAGTQSTCPELGHSVHVELRGLGAGRDYFYRFRADGHLSPTGRTRTSPPAPPADLPALTFCVASCAEFEHGWYTAYRRLAEDGPDLVLHLGDYIYENPARSYLAASGNVRDHVGPELRALADYRRRYAQYKTDADLQAAHAVAPWLAVFDDHEVADDWAGDHPATPDPDFHARRANALRAYWENMPLRAAARPTGADMALHRRVRWGALATFHMLDTRQYRDARPCGGVARSDCPERTSAARTILGAGQERWLTEGLRASAARWDVLAQQVLFAQVDLGRDGPGFNLDAWDGYPASRDRVVDAWTSAPARNAVVLSGDAHAHWAADVRHRWDDPASPVVGTELVTTSITSGGDGSQTRDDIAAVLPKNPHVRFFDDQRGYVRARLTGDELRAEFRVVPFVSRPGAPVETRATFVVADRTPGLRRA